MIKMKIGTAAFMGILMIFGMTMTVGAEETKNVAFWTDSATEAAVSSLETAVGQEQVIRFNAEVPAGKTLKAYSFMVMYDPEMLEVVDAVAAPNAQLKPTAINTETAGEIVVNGFKVTGVKGEKNAEGVSQDITVSLIDVTLKALSPDASHVTVLFSGFGESGSDEFKPAVSPLVVVGN